MTAAVSMCECAPVAITRNVIDAQRLGVMRFARASEDRVTQFPYDLNFHPSVSAD